MGRRLAPTHRLRALNRFVEDSAAQGLRLLLAGAVAGLGLAAIATVFAKSWWVFDLATHFRVHYVAGAMIAAVLALILRRPAVAFAVVVLALPHVLAVSSLVPLSLSTAVAAGPATPVRVTTVNAYWANWAPDRLAEYVDRTAPDILVVQEADRRWRTALLRLASRFPYAAPEDWRDSRDVLVFSRFPILRAERRYPEGRGFAYQVAEIDVAGEAVTVVGVHPPLPAGADLSRMRNLYMADVARLVRERGHPAIVAGDFNSTVWSPHYADFVEDAGLSNAGDGRGWRPTWPNWLPTAGIAIDHVLVNDRFSVHGIERGPEVGSDHFPLTADLLLE